MNEIVIFVGIPASGKTSFYKERFFPSHVYVSQDQLRTGSAVEELFRFCIRRNKKCVIDKCNISVPDRQKYIRVAHSHGAKAIGYCFVTKKEDALARNAARPEATRVKEVAIRSAYSWMQYPKLEEGFDELYFVRIVNGEYVVEAWHETERFE